MLNTIMLKAEITLKANFFIINASYSTANTRQAEQVVSGENKEVN